MPDRARAIDRHRVKVDIQGAATIRKIMPLAVFVFLAPPSLGELTARLTRRLTESPIDLSLRIKTAEAEMKQAVLFDHVVVNHGGATSTDITALANHIRGKVREQFGVELVQEPIAF